MQRVRLSSEQAPVHKLGDSQMTLSSKFRLNIARSSPSSPELKPFLAGEPLIPGLPDDIALNCLLRLPIESHSSCRSVCKRWLSLLGTKRRFFAGRTECGFRDPWLFVLAFNKNTENIQWQVLNLNNFTWHDIPAMPRRDKVCPHGLQCVSVPESGSLFVCGGSVSDVDCPSDLVLKFEIRENRWTVINRMITARSFFASGLIDNTIYAAGGNSADLFELDSAEVLDPREGIWRPIKSMGSNMASYDSAVVNNKLYVTEGWLWPFYVSPRGRVYDPKTDSWETMAVGLREGWTGSSAVVHGHLFVVSELERMKLKVYYEESDSWEAIDGSPMPDRMCKPFSVSSCGSRLYVVGRDLCVAVGQISRLGLISGPEKRRFGVRWQVFDAPERLGELLPSSSQVLFG